MKYSEPYLKPAFSPKSLDKFLIRKAILDALMSQREKLRGTVLDVGCGKMPYKSLLLESGGGSATAYVGLDFENNPIHNNRPDIHWVNGCIPLSDNCVDSAVCTEVLEHCPVPGNVLKEIHRVLRPGGHLFLTVPFIWPLHEVPFDNYRYTPYSLYRHLDEVGFSEINLHASGGWDASLAQMLGLWAKRSGLGRFGRRFAVIALLPVCGWLILRDRSRPVREFQEGTMLTGIWGTAMKPQAGQGADKV